MIRCSLLLLVVCIASLAALAGCAGDSAPELRDNLPAPVTRLNWPPTPERQLAQQRAFSRLVPPAASVALDQLGAPLPGAAAAAAGKGTSVALPYNMPADQGYTAGAGGYIGNSLDVGFGGGGADLAPSGPAFPNNFSYVLYRVDDLADAVLTLDVGMGPTLPGQQCGVAVYNWGYATLGRWEPLYFGPVSPGGVQVDLTGVPGSDWTSAGNDLACVVFCLDPSSFTITSLTFSGAAANNPPVAQLQALPDWGTAPLNVTLDAQGSFDSDGSITLYRFDPEGDGNWIDNGSDATLDYVYTATGAFHAAVAVTDDGGATATQWTSVVVSPGVYSEMEDNDLSTQANGLPTIPFGNFWGNIGLGGSYDGDEFDWFTFPADPGDTVNFLLEFAPSADADFEVYLFDGFNELAMSAGWPPQPLSHTFDGSESGPFYVAVRNLSGVASDYLLTCDNAAYEEVEDNDAAGSANWWALFEVNHVMTDFDGSIGSPGYDGDSDDWYTFSTGAPPWTIDLELTYDNSEVKVGYALFDALGTELARSAQGDGNEQLSYAVQFSDQQPYYVQCYLIGGNGDYSVSGTITP
jgi:hypothetical protein